MKKPVARRHHYVPQSYLAFFTESEDKNGSFYALDRKTGKSFPTSPLNVANIRDFNRIDVVGQRPDALESKFGEIEGKASEAIFWISQNRVFPNSEHWEYVINLIVLLLTRNPKEREIYDALWIKAYGEDDHQASRKGRSKGSPNSYFEAVSYTSTQIFNCVAHRYWSIMISEDDHPEFISCDHPVVLKHKSDQGKAIGVCVKNTELIFPISRRVALYGVFEDQLDPIYKCSPGEIARINNEVVNNAFMHIFSARTEFTILSNGEIGIVEVV